MAGRAASSSENVHKLHVRRPPLSASNTHAPRTPPVARQAHYPLPHTAACTSAPARRASAAGDTPRSKLGRARATIPPEAPSFLGAPARLPNSFPAPPRPCSPTPRRPLSSSRAAGYSGGLGTRSRPGGQRERTLARARSSKASLTLTRLRTRCHATDAWRSTARGGRAGIRPSLEGSPSRSPSRARATRSRSARRPPQTHQRPLPRSRAQRTRCPTACPPHEVPPPEPPEPIHLLGGQELATKSGPEACRGRPGL